MTLCLGCKLSHAFRVGSGLQNVPMPNALSYPSVFWVAPCFFLTAWVRVPVNTTAAAPPSWQASLEQMVLISS